MNLCSQKTKDEVYQDMLERGRKLNSEYCEGYLILGGMVAEHTFVGDESKITLDMISAQRTKVENLEKELNSFVEEWKFMGFATGDSPNN